MSLEDQINSLRNEIRNNQIIQAKQLEQLENMALAQRGVAPLPDIVSMVNNAVVKPVVQQPVVTQPVVQSTVVEEKPKEEKSMISKEEQEQRAYILKILHAVGSALPVETQLWLTKNAGKEIDAVTGFLESQEGPEIAISINNSFKKALFGAF